MKKIIICIILWLLVVSVMCFIFSMSAEPASDSTQTSGNTLRAILKVVYPGFCDMDEVHQQEIIDQNQYFIRKTAHFSIYMLLGALVSLAMAQHIRRFSLISCGIGALYAVSDEIHQYFVPGRSCQISDMLLDMSGVALGCLIIYFINKIRLKKTN